MIAILSIEHFHNFRSNADDNAKRNPFENSKILEIVKCLPIRIFYEK